MLKRFISALSVLTAFLLVSSLSLSVVKAVNCDALSCDDKQSTEEHLSCNKEKRQCLEGKLNEVKKAKITLGNTISILNNQISIQELAIDSLVTQITALEKEIEELTGRISGLNLSLDKLTDVLIERIQASYKKRYSGLDLLSNGSFNRISKQSKQLQQTQKHTAQLMLSASNQRATYDDQKALKEEKQEVVAQKKQQLQSEQDKVVKQKSEQEYLLVETKHNESRYQAELAKTLAELEAIQSIIAGKGDESEVGGVEKGETIASIISGASPCSTGTHLHFEVVKDGSHRNPASFLKSADIKWNNSPDGSFGFSGGWDWPLSDPAKVNQGYGMTYYARVRRAYAGSPHTGIDIASKSNNLAVKSVSKGNLFRGSIKCGSGSLRYVRVAHDTDDISTYYLHVNY